MLTLRGEALVEDVPIGEMLVGVSGAGAPYVPLRFKRITRHDLRARPWASPLRIRADALGQGVPMVDLLVAPGQALLLDGALVPAWRLADGFGIAPEPGLTEATFVRLALDGSDAVVAAGLAVATDCDIRDSGAPRPACAPDMGNTELGALLAYLRARAETLGWAQPVACATPPEPRASRRMRLRASTALPLLMQGPALPESFDQG